MADEVWNGVQPSAPMDDDRLLAYALGLDDDPELAHAAAEDADLGRRLESVRADVDRVAANVRAAVPAPDDTYTDLRDARWASMQEYFTPVAERPAHRSGGSRRWLRVLAPVVAVALAVAVGVSVIDRQNGSQTSSAERTAKAGDSMSAGGSAVAGAPVAASSAGAGQSGSGAAASSGVPAGAGSPAPLSSAPGPAGALTRLAALHEEMDDFALVVLATARRATAGFQDFIVVRVFRGDSPKLLRLKLAGRLADVGRLHLLLLRPVSASEAAPLPAASDAGGDWTQETSSTAVAAAEAEMLTTSVPVMYTYEGGTAVARELPYGTDPSSVLLP